MNNILIGIGVLIVAVLSALFAVPRFVDWNSYRGVIEEEASRIAGRDVRIGGKIELQLLPVPSFTIQKLRIADAATGSGEPLFRADRVEAKLSIAPLVRGVLEANEIELVKPVVHIVLDEAGRGNWRDLAQGSGTLPFVPKDVALQAVKITDGTISVRDRNGTRERLKIDHLAGQLSSPALKGPYRFAGSFGDDGQHRDLRFSTVPIDANGSLQFKAALKDVASSASATLDGRLRDIGGQPTLTGDLTATLPRAQPAGQSVQAGSASAVPLADLKAEVVGDSNRFELKNLSVAFDSAGRPEVLSGGAQFSWDGALTTTARLATPWIDLDNVLGNPEGGNPLLALAAFVKRINSLVPATGSTSTILEIDQASLGHDAISSIRIDARSSGGLLAVQEARATLPGGSRIEMQGSISGQGAGTTFDGDLTLRGASLARFAGWATAGGFAIAPANDQAFQMRSRVTIEPSISGLHDIVADIGGSALEGTIDYSWQNQRQLRIAVEGARIDARAFAPAKLSLDALSRLMTPNQTAPAAATGSAAVRSDDSASALKVRVELETAELVLPDQTLRDVSAQVEAMPDGLNIERMQFSASHGVAVNVSGLLGSSSTAVPLRGSVAAGDIVGLHKLIALVDFPPGLVPQRWAASLVPLRLAGTLTRTPGLAASPFLVALEGQLGPINATIKAELARGRDGWQAAPADIDLVLLAPKDANLAALSLALLRGAPPRLQGDPDGRLQPLPVPTDATAAGMTRIAVRASGVPATRLMTTARFDSPDVTLYFNGTSTVDAATNVRVEGATTLDARDGRDLLEQVGGLRLALPGPLVLNGQARLVVHDGAIELNNLALLAGGVTEVAGNLQLATDATGLAPVEGSRHLTGALSVTALDASTVLAAVRQTGNGIADTTAAAASAAGAHGSVWPQGTFDFSRLNGLDMVVALKTATFTLADGVALKNVDFMMLGRHGALEIRDLTGVGLGGRATASVLLESVPAGASLTARVGIAGADLAVFGGTGTANAQWTLSGSGLTPAGLAAALGGRGEIQLGTDEVHALTPESLQAAVDAALKTTPDKMGAELRSALTAPAARPVVSIGPRVLKMAVQDGVARVEPIEMQTPEGAVTGTASFDFSTLGLGGAWRVETRLPPPVAVAEPPQSGPPVQLPAVLERFTVEPGGADGGAKLLRARVQTEALERELAVRKVERDLAELERLRQQDDARAAEARARAAQSAAEQADWNRQTEIKANTNTKPDPAAAQARP